MDLAQAVVVGLVSGAGGALLTTLLRIRHERDERFRDRLIDAADDFSTGAQQAMIGLRDALVAFEKTDDPQAFDLRLQRAVELIDETHARLARVELLFGADSQAGEAASRVLHELRRSSHALSARPRPLSEAQIDDERDVQVWGSYSEATRLVIENHAGFNRAARDAVRKRPWWRTSGAWDWLSEAVYAVLRPSRRRARR